jgi:hypothetical protein
MANDTSFHITSRIEFDSFLGVQRCEVNFMPPLGSVRRTKWMLWEVA